MPECKGKIRYASLGDAQRGLELAKRTLPYPPVRWYRCDVCGDYHLTAKAEQPKGDLAAQERAFRENREQRRRAQRNRSPFAGLPDPTKEDDDA